MILTTALLLTLPVVVVLAVKKIRDNAALHQPDEHAIRQTGDVFIADNNAMMFVNGDDTLTRREKLRPPPYSAI